MQHAPDGIRKKKEGTEKDRECKNESFGRFVSMSRRLCTETTARLTD